MDISDPYTERFETNSTSITTPEVYTHISQIPPDPRWQRITDLIAAWKVERDMKCPNCKRGDELGKLGCHYEHGYSVGNCKAWPLSRKIQQLEEVVQP